MNIARGVEPAAHVDVVIAKISACGSCERHPALDSSLSFAFLHTDAADTAAEKTLLFIPRPSGRYGYYTQAQLEEINHSLACRGIDLLPLDPNLMH